MADPGVSPTSPLVWGLNPLSIFSNSDFPKREKTKYCTILSSFEIFMAVQPRR
jgi:hypothetical protein